MIRPINAAIKVFRAAVTFSLFPCDRIQLIPPQMRKKRAIKMAITKTPWMTLLINVLTEVLQTPPNVPLGQTLIGPCVSSGLDAIDIVAPNESIKPSPVAAAMPLRIYLFCIYLCKQTTRSLSTPSFS